MKKRVFSLFVASALCLNLPAAVLAEEPGDENTPVLQEAVSAPEALNDSTETNRTSIADASVEMQPLTYDGTAQTPTMKIQCNDRYLQEGTDYEVAVTPQTNAGTYDLTITGKGSYEGTKVISWSIEKSDGNLAIEDGIATAEKRITIVNKRQKTYEIDLAEYLLALSDGMAYGKVSYSNLRVDLRGYYSEGSWGKAEIDANGKLTLPIVTNNSEGIGDVGEVVVNVASANIKDFILWIDVDAINKRLPEGEPTPDRTTLTYGEKLSSITLTGTMKDGETIVPGEFHWKDSSEEESLLNAGEYEMKWVFSPTDKETYVDMEGSIKITVNQATPTGTPSYTAITTSGKTLEDANLTVGTIQPEGYIQWVDENGEEMDISTEVQVNTGYHWRFVPYNDINYKELSGTIELWHKRKSSGGSSSSGTDNKTADTVTSPDGTIVKTETQSDGTIIRTETKPDGTIIRTETNPDGAIIETETKPDGAIIKTEIKPDSTIVTTETKPDGTIIRTEFKPDGSIIEMITDYDDSGSMTTKTVPVNGEGIEVKANFSEKAVEDAKQNDAAVKIPTEVKASKNSNYATTVDIKIPGGLGETKVEIPVSNVTSGTVAVIVHPDGTEEIIKDTKLTESGIQIKINGDTIVKIIDHSKDFSDTNDHWAKDSIDFVIARGLFVGVDSNRFGVNDPMTRGMLNTVLARLAGVDTTPNIGQKWYEVGTDWAKKNGITDGTNPNGEITREQLAAMLYRSAGSPQVSGNMSFADASAVSDYAKDSILWAEQNGILSGYGNNLAAPKADAQRAEVAAMLANYLQNQ